MRTPILAAAFALLAPLVQLHAGHEVIEQSGKKTVMTDDEFPFTKGTKDFSIAGAAFGSIGTEGTARRPDAGYAIGEVRFGLMLTDPKGPGILRGNLELLVEGIGGGFFDGPGNGLGGAQLLFRYNFVKPHARFVPFLQVGGGGLYTDAAYEDRIQRNIGRNWSFDLSAEFGGRIMLSRNVGLQLGLEYRHFSNADTADRNRGLNALGGELGVAWFF